ncbi:MAG: acetoacetate decarboxylase family protein [Anaerolineae bacterium]|jgi:hypothetical protein|nr:acetoacetate decarboxylase family protein [Anaerolineae bacterium]
MNAYATDRTHTTIVPPPWSLTGNGYILVYRFPRPFLEASGALDDTAHLGEFVGGLGVVMLVNYTSSDAGPYRELLFIPGAFKHPRGRFYSITRIYVSTQVSVVSGRENWGIPKQWATFAEKDGVTTVSVGGQMVGRFELSGTGPALPTTTGLIPRRWRTLIQTYGSGALLTTPEASGRTGLAKVGRIECDPAHFPDLSGLRPLLALHAPRFQMTFPFSVGAEQIESAQ